MSKDQPASKEAAESWARENLERAVHELMDAGKLGGITIESRPAWAMAGRYVIGQVRDVNVAGGFTWVIAGDFETDTISSGVAGSVRDAARHFSLKWQLDADKSPDTAQSLIQRAEELYAIAETDEAWQHLS